MGRNVRFLSIVMMWAAANLAPDIAFAQPSAMTGAGLRKTLTLQEVLGRIQASPLLKAAEMGIEVRRGHETQAGLLPNPDIAVEVENFGGKGDLEGFDGAETTISISQLIELGGKRQARKIVSGQEKSLAEWDFQSRKQDLQLEGMRAFYVLLAVQKRLDQARQLLTLADQGYQTVADRVEAGKISPVQELRARVELNLARNAFESAERQLSQARQDLAAKWGDPTPDFEGVAGDFDEMTEPAEWQELQDSFPNNPDVRRWEAELAGKTANLNLERANAVPDVTLAFGVRNYQETGDNALVAGLEFPLPLFDRNQGRRTAAKAEFSQAFHRRDASVAGLSSDLRSAYQKLLAAYHQARTVRQEIMPAAERANDAAQIGYREGKFDFLEALDAQRTLFEVKALNIEAFLAYHEARLEVLRLAGRFDQFPSL